MLDRMLVDARTEPPMDAFHLDALHDLIRSEAFAIRMLAMEQGGGHPNLVRDLDMFRVYGDHALLLEHITKPTKDGCQVKTL
jgi:hypothetical protein